MDYLKKGTLVFVHTESYPPWPAEVERKYENGLYKVNFIGEKSYTRIEKDKIDLFTEERAKQIHSELEDKKLSKAIFVALKEFENRKRRGEIDQELSEILKKQLPPLDLSMYKDSSKQETNQNSLKQYTSQSAFNAGFSKFLPSSSTSDNLDEIGETLDKIYNFIVLPVHEKLPQYMEEAQYAEKKQKIDQEIYKIKQLFIKEEENYKPTNTIGSGLIKDFSEKEPRGSSSSYISEPNYGSKKNVSAITKTSEKQNSVFMEKLVDARIIEKIIMTIKAYESFREENEKQFDEIINFLREKFNIFYDKFREEYNKKKLPSNKDRIMLEKFESFQAYL